MILSNRLLFIPMYAKMIQFDYRLFVNLVAQITKFRCFLWGLGAFSITWHGQLVSFVEAADSTIHGGFSKNDMAWNDRPSFFNKVGCFSKNRGIFYP